MSKPLRLRTVPVLFLAGIFCLSLFFSSCYTAKNYTYLQGPFDTASLSNIPVSDPLIRKGDILSIVVFSDDPAATALYNQSMPAVGNSGAAAGGLGSSGAGPTGGGYIVDEKGNIEMQGLGLLHIEGITRKQLRDSLDKKLTRFLKSPYYSIRFLNYKVTILGEVVKPGPISIPGTQVSLLEALGMAGDMTFYGRRDNVLVIRENQGKREFGRMDLTKPEVMNSPYYYLQQNDIVIIEQSKKKIAANDQTLFRNLSITTSVASIVVLLYTLFRK